MRRARLAMMRMREGMLIGMATRGEEMNAAGNDERRRCESSARSIRMCPSKIGVGKICITVPWRGGESGCDDQSMLCGVTFIIKNNIRLLSENSEARRRLKNTV